MHPDRFAVYGKTEQKELILKNIRSDVLIFSTSLRAYNSEANSLLKFIKSTDSIYSSFTFYNPPDSISPTGETFEIFYNSNKVSVSTTYRTSNKYIRIIKFLVHGEQRRRIDSFNIVSIASACQRFNECKDLLELKNILNNSEKFLLLTVFGQLYFQLSKFESRQEDLNDQFLTSNHPKYVTLRDSLGINFYDPIGEVWDNVDPNYFHHYDCTYSGVNPPGCSIGNFLHKFAYRSTVMLHNALLKGNFVSGSNRVFGNDGNRQRFRRGLIYVEDSIVETYEKQLLLWALMCKNISLPVMQDFVFGETTSVSDKHSEANTERVFPNPASDYCNVQSEYGATVRIYDVVGRLKYAGKIGESGTIRIDVQSYETGFYTVEIIEKGEKKSVETLIVQ